MLPNVPNLPWSPLATKNRISVLIPTKEGLLFQVEAVGDTPGDLIETFRAQVGEIGYVPTVLQQHGLVPMPLVGVQSGKGGASPPDQPRQGREVPAGYFPSRT